MGLSASSTVNFLPCPLEVMNKRQCVEYLRRLILLEYEAKYGKCPEKVRTNNTFIVHIYSLISHPTKLYCTQLQ